MTDKEYIQQLEDFINGCLAQTDASELVDFVTKNAEDALRGKPC